MKRIPPIVEVYAGIASLISSFLQVNFGTLEEQWLPYVFEGTRVLIAQDIMVRPQRAAIWYGV